MQIGQTRAINQYRAAMQSTQAAEAVGNAPEEESSQTQAAEAAANTDRVELSADANVSKMSDSERAALVESLKADQENQMNRFINMMTQMLQTQGITASTAQSGNFWKMIASGNFTVDAETKAAAQQAISEDGYWGVKQTSQRIFDMASALAGDDVEKMQKMQEAVEKGFEQASIAWGGKLPSITDDTHEAINKMFEDYYAQHSKEPVDEEEAPEETEDVKAEGAEGEEEAESEKEGGSVGFNEGKRARQLAAAASRNDVQAVIALLNKDLSDCKAGLEKGWCDEAEVAKVEAMIRRAAQRMSEVSRSGEDTQQDGLDAFAIASLM